MFKGFISLTPHSNSKGGITIPHFTDENKALEVGLAGSPPAPLAPQYANSGAHTHNTNTEWPPKRYLWILGITSLKQVTLGGTRNWFHHMSCRYVLCDLEQIWGPSCLLCKGGGTITLLISEGCRQMGLGRCSLRAVKNEEGTEV